MKPIIYLFPILILFFTSCKNNKTHEDTNKPETHVNNKPCDPVQTLPLDTVKPETNKNNDVNKDIADTDKTLKAYLSDLTIKDMDDDEKNDMRTLIKSFRSKTVPYSSIRKINEELKNIQNVSDDFHDPAHGELFISRLKHHLSNPLTFKTDLTSSASDPFSWIDIAHSPDGKYKLYSVDDLTGGTMRSYKNFIQYENDSGRVECKPWLKKVRFDASFRYRNIYQFRDENEDYYIFTGYKRLATALYEYCLYVVSIDSGKPTFHTDFYPKRIKVDKFRYADEYSKRANNPPMPCVYIGDCEGGDPNVEYNPETKTISYITCGHEHTGGGKNKVSTKTRKEKFRFEINQ